MKQLMERIPFDQITTAEIIDACGISRKTFYYHFKDKYELVNWIFSEEIIDEIVNETTFENLTNCYMKFCNYILDNKKFCINAISADGQNCLIQFLYDYVKRQINILCHEAINKGILTTDDVEFLIEYYYSAFIGVLKAWIKNDLKDDPKIIINRWMSVVDQNLEHYIKTHGKHFVR